MEGRRLGVEKESHAEKGQTARERDPSPRVTQPRDPITREQKSLHEEKYKDEEDDFFNFLEPERQEWSEVERIHDQIENVRGCVVASKVERKSARPVPSEFFHFSPWSSLTTHSLVAASLCSLKIGVQASSMSAYTCSASAV